MNIPVEIFNAIIDFKFLIDLDSQYGEDTLTKSFSYIALISKRMLETVRQLRFNNVTFSRSDKLKSYYEFWGTYTLSTYDNYELFMEWNRSNNLEYNFIEYIKNVEIQLGSAFELFIYSRITSHFDR